MDARIRFASELFQISRRWRIRLDDRLSRFGQTKAGWVLFYWIARNPDGVVQRDLAEQVGLETSTLTRQLDVLQARGLIERVGAAGDRRAKLVRLAPGAESTMAAVGEVTRELRDELLEGITDAQLATTLEVLEIVHGRLRRAARAADGEG